MMNQHLSCSEALEVLDQYLDGELAEPGSNAIEAHLGDCGRCRAEADVQLLIKSSVHDCMPAEPAPHALVEHVRMRLRTTRVEWVSQVVVRQTIRIEFREP